MTHTRFDPLEAGARREQAARRVHYEEGPAARSFWKEAAASLPPRARRRYAHLFDAAERYEPVVDFIVDRCAAAAGLLAKILRAGRARSETARPRRFREIGKAT